MNNKITLLSVILLTVALAACSEENPSFRVRNDLSNKINVQVKPDVGNTLNLNDVDGGASTGFITISKGGNTVKASIQGESEEPSIEFTAEMDYNYTAVVHNTDPPVMSIESEEK